MINFRYHIVSIIGIFIALAVGVVLGAGPLQSRIQAGVSTSSSTAATDPQVSAQADAEAAGLKALASSALSGSLAGAKVALVVLPGASDDDVSALRSTLTDAGASVVGRVTLSDNWQSTSMNQYRTTLSTTLASHLASPAAKTASADGVVGYSIVQVLTSTGSETDLLRQILTDDSTPIMTIDEDPSGTATSIVAVGPCAVRCWHRCDACCGDIELGRVGRPGSGCRFDLRRSRGRRLDARGDGEPGARERHHCDDC